MTIALVAAATRSGTPHHEFSAGTITPHRRCRPATRRAGEECGRQCQRRAVNVCNDAAGLAVRDAAAELADVFNVLGDHVALVQPRQHRDSAEHRDDPEHSLGEPIRYQS
jgi:hypothetical protein